MTSRCQAFALRLRPISCLRWSILLALGLILASLIGARFVGASRKQPKETQLTNLFASTHRSAEQRRPLVVQPIVVNSTADTTTAGDGRCTLREAINNANTNSDTTGADCVTGHVGLDIIEFAIPGTDPNCDGTTHVCTITPATALPPITDPVTIDGYTQTFSSVNTNAFGLADNAVLTIELNGTNLSSGSFAFDNSGLKINAGGGGTTIRGLVINRFGDAAIVVNSATASSTAGGDFITGNFIGTDPAGENISAAAGGEPYGIAINGSAGTTIGGTASSARNIISGQAFAGVYISNQYVSGAANNNLVEGNYIGTDKSGSIALADATGSGDGVELFTTAGGNTVGGVAVGAGNVISGQINDGVLATEPSSSIQGNLIGTKADGTGALGNNTFGIDVSGPNDLVGGATSPAGNVVADNNGSGVVISAGNNITVQGNTIANNSNVGLEVDGNNNQIIGNTLSGNVGANVAITGASNMLSNNAISNATGGSSPATLGIGVLVAGDNNSLSQNSIHDNAGEGVFIATPSLTECSSCTEHLVSGASVSGNSISANSIYSNGRLGIDLDPQGVTANDACDGDTGPNNLQNFPVITSVVTNAGVTTIQGTLNSTASTQFTIEFFANATVDPTSYGEGQTFLGSTTVTTLPSCTQAFLFVPSSPVAVGLYISATATDPNGNTSEFSQDHQVTSPTAAPSTISGTVTKSDGSPFGGVVVQLGGTSTRLTISDASGHYHFDDLDTGNFCTVTPSRANYSFSPASRSFSLLGVRTEASFTANPNGDQANAIDTTEFFVRQQYLDFLGREPDPPGFAGWVNTIRNCAPGDTSCDRVHVSEMFYRSAEFQERGYFAYRFYTTALGRKPDYAEFMPDLQQVSGFLTNDQLEAAKNSLVSNFMMRPEFASRYGSLSNTAYVDQLLSTAGVSVSNRQTLIDSLNNGSASRAQVLRQIAESGEVDQKYCNQAFVVMEYFGYLRRDPDALYTNWITVLDAKPADSRHMVEGFVNSAEYRNRFAQ